MKLLAIIGCIIGCLLLLIALLIVLVCTLRIKIYVSYKMDPSSSGDGLLYATVGPYKKVLYPEKEDKLKLSDFSAKKYRAMLAEDAKRKTAAQSKKKDDKKSEENLPTDVLNTLKLVLNLIKTFRKYLRCEIAKIRITFGTKDAATTAVSYSAVTSAVALIIDFLDHHVDTRMRSPKDIYVKADFDKACLYGDIDLRFSIRVLDFFRAGGSLSDEFLSTGVPLTETSSNNLQNKISRITTERR